MMGTLLNGLPSIMIPLGADQIFDARRVTGAGAGTYLRPRVATPPIIREVVQRLMAESLYKRNALRIKAEIETLPPLTSGARWIEECVRRHRSSVLQRVSI
jgi:UDP:flavonoid glycosyltransferase YjiC (YdhE family)